MSHKEGTHWQPIYEERDNSIIPDVSNEDVDIFESIINKIPIVTKCPLSWDSPEDSVYD